MASPSREVAQAPLKSRTTACVRATPYASRRGPGVLAAAATGAALMLATALGHAAPREANDVELRAAYCIVVIQEEVTLANQLWVQTRSLTGVAAPATVSDESLVTGLARESRAGPATRSSGARDAALERIEKAMRERETALNRLRSYLVPKLQYLDQGPLTAATQRADADRSAALQIAAACTQQCSGGQQPCSSACFDKAAASIVERFKGCRDPSWLPF